MNGPQWVTVGVVVGAHGVRGEVRVKPLTDFPDRLLSTEALYTQDDEDERVRRYAVQSSRAHGKGHYLMKLSGVEDRDAADAMRGVELKVGRADVVPLPAGSYYVFELVGAQVRTESGELLGTLADVITTGANDVYQVRDAMGKELLLPAIRDVVKKIDPHGKVIVVDPLDGLV